MMLPIIVVLTGTIIVAVRGADKITLKDEQSRVANYNVVQDYRRSLNESLHKVRDDSRAKWEQSRSGLNLRQQEVSPAAPWPIPLKHPDKWQSSFFTANIDCSGDYIGGYMAPLNVCRASLFGGPSMMVAVR
jgi:hypothetical protein